MTRMTIYSSDQPMTEWNDQQLIDYLFDGMPAPSRETAGRLLEIRSAMRNREASKKTQESARRMETAVFILLAVALIQAFAAVAPFFR